MSLGSAASTNSIPAGLGLVVAPSAVVPSALEPRQRKGLSKPPALPSSGRVHLSATRIHRLESPQFAVWLIRQLPPPKRRCLSYRRDLCPRLRRRANRSISALSRVFAARTWGTVPLIAL